MTLRKRLFRTAKEALSRHEECSSAMRNGLPRIAGKPVWQTVGDKNGHGYVFSCNADAVLRRFRFCFAVFLCQYFLLPFPYIYTTCSSHAMHVLRLRHAARSVARVAEKPVERISVAHSVPVFIELRRRAPVLLSAERRVFQRSHACHAVNRLAPLLLAFRHFSQ